jgi:UDP-N-acetylglucosamine diphosphorylase/glucosamine-1-phosphate N-acetyltransferase
MSLAPLNLLRPAEDLRLGILSFRERRARGADLPVPAHAWDFPRLNADAIRSDFSLLTRDRASAHIPGHVRTTRPDNIFLEPGTRLEHCTLNAADGPIYIAAGALVMDGVCIRGPVAIGEGAVLKMNASIYGGTTIGPRCIVGGEVKNSIVMDYSNKAHDGYLGDSVVGAWCNLGAGTSTSNIRNTGNPVSAWDADAQAFRPAGQKLGLVMGDFSRTAILTAFNTGTVVGACAHVFGHTALTPKWIPSFAWGPDDRADIEKTLQQLRNWMAFKGASPSEALVATIRTLHSQP